MKKLALACLTVALGGCGAGVRPVVVGSKNFTEQVILGEILACFLGERGVPVERKLNLGGTFICHRAIRAGELDIYVEYTGTALTAILKKPIAQDPEEVYRTVKEEYQRQFGLEWGAPLGFNNTFALVMRADHAASLGVKRISDLAPKAGSIRTGFGYEFLEREDGFKGLARAYSLEFAIRPREMELGLIYPALAQGEVDLVAGNSTDGLIEALKLVALEDDRRYFPPYYAAPVVRPDSLSNHPELGEAVERLAGQIDETTMRKLNSAVDAQHRQAREVAREFLIERGFLAKPGKP